MFFRRTARALKALTSEDAARNATERSSFVLVAGPPVRASSWEPTARFLRGAGYSVQVPDIMAHHDCPPAWSAWTNKLLDLIAPNDESILVGHSSATALVADLATKLRVHGIILVDGDVPPGKGPASAVRPALRDFVRRLADADGMLPIWSKWFAGDRQRSILVGMDVLARDAAALAHFENGLPRMRVDWFDDVIELTGWDHIPAGFIQTSDIYDHATDEARRRGWPVARLQGPHLDPSLRPAETANAIVAMSQRLNISP